MSLTRTKTAFCSTARLTLYTCPIGRCQYPNPVIDLLAYEEPANGSLSENTKRLAWNGSSLSDLYLLTILLVLKSTRATGDDMYRLTAESVVLAGK